MYLLTSHLSPFKDVQNLASQNNSVLPLKQNQPVNLTLVESLGELKRQEAAKQQSN